MQSRLFLFLATALFIGSPALAADGPTITLQPKSQIAILNQTAVFNVEAIGTPPISYRWFRNNSDLFWTDPSLSLIGVTAASAGNYFVVVSNAVNSVTSSVQVVDIQTLLTIYISGAGYVSSSPSAASYVPSSSVILTATPWPNSTFLGWSGSATGTNNPLTVVMNQNKTITANFSGPAVADIILDNDNTNVTFTGSWQSGSSAPDKFGSNYRFAIGTESGASNAVYRPIITTAGKYDVSIWYPLGANRGSNTYWTVSSDSGVQTNYVNQRDTGGRWVQIASAQDFSVGTNAFVKLINYMPPGWTNNNIVLADAVRFSFVNPPLLTAAASTTAPDEFILSLLGRPGTTYSIEASTNLVNWPEITNINMTDAVNKFTESVSEKQNYYRAVQH